MTDKDNVSMATVQMKPDYAASEVYSTASEPPPAYKRQANSVKIAKITAFTIIISSFILGAFILASSYLQAKASCDQVQALDSVLEKELMLETLQQVNKELPRAEALLGKDNSDSDDLQNIDKDEPVLKKVEIKPVQASHAVDEEESHNNAADTDNNYSDSDEAEEFQKYPGKMPLELDLSDLAAAILRNNKKSRMNCVVERKHAEEIVDAPSKTVTLPFGVNLTTDPKKARITGERISIFCDGGDDNKDQDQQSKNHHRDEEDDIEDDVESLRPMFIPFQRLPIPFGRIPQQFPLTHMPARMMPPVHPQQHQLPQQFMQQPQSQQLPAFLRQLTPPTFQQLPLALRPPMPPQVMQAPRMEPQPEPQQQTVRIHVQQIPFREIHVSDEVPMQIAPEPQREVPQFQIQRMPLGVALQRAGITADDLRNIQRMAEERITDELRRLAAEEAAESADSSSSSNSSSEEEDTSDPSVLSNENQREREQQQERTQSAPPQQQQQQQQQQQHIAEQPERAPIPRLILQPLPEQPRDTMSPPMPDQPAQPMQYGRVAFGRSLAQPVSIPVPMMMQQVQQMNDDDSSSQPPNMSTSTIASERPHFVQPRSV